MLSSTRRQRKEGTGGGTLYRVRWDGDCNCHHLPTCRCTLIVTFPHVQEIEMRVPRVDNGRVLTLEEQYLRLLQLCAQYDVVKDEEGNWRASLITDKDLATKMSSMIVFQYYGQRESNRLVRPPFVVRNTPQPFVPEWHPKLRTAVDRMDEIYMMAYGRKMPTNPLLDAEFEQGQPSKTRQWYNKHLFSRHVYGRFKGYSPIVHTMEDLSAAKIADLFAEFSQNETESREHFDEIKKMLPQALALLDVMLRTRHHHGTVAFRYRPEMLKNFVTNMQSSAGVRPGRVYERSVEGARVTFTPTGKKFHQFPVYAAEFHKLLQDIWKAEDLYDRYKGDVDYYCIIRLKNEFKVKWLPDIPDNELEDTLRKMRAGCREFFIPNMMQQFLSKLLMTPKQLFERGEVIRIGQKWKYGEAEKFARRFHAFSKTHRWFTGDVRKLDKNIRDWLLSLYVASGRPYFKADDEKTDAFLDRLFVLLAERINVKLTCHITGLWTLMKGVMYSGGFETSHGDSWILALVFCFYFVFVIQSHPEVAAEVVRSIRLTLLVIALYGDDHLLAVPLSLVPYINEKGFAAFALKYFGMVIRDIEELDDFFSQVDSAGELTKKGVVFLKRYFILSKPFGEGYPVVYPFKPTHETILKLVCNKDNDPRTYPLQAIGQAYDTLGTNPVAYAMVQSFYQYWMAELDFDQEGLTQYMNSMNAQTRNRLWRKAGLNWKTSTFCFPTLAHLQGLHKIDRKQGSNEIPRCVVEGFYGVEATELEEVMRGEYLSRYDLWQ